VAFTNLSSGATNFAWDFGDGNASTAINPANTYSNAGSYSVTLTAVGLGGTNTLTLTNHIVATNQPPPPVIANFSAQPTNGTVPLLVTFTNLSSGATNFAWDFGDGNAITAANPANTYFETRGVIQSPSPPYGLGGTNTLTLTNYIVATNQPPRRLSWRIFQRSRPMAQLHCW